MPLLHHFFGLILFGAIVVFKSSRVRYFTENGVTTSFTYRSLVEEDGLPIAKRNATASFIAGVVICAVSTTLLENLL